MTAIWVGLVLVGIGVWGVLHMLPEIIILLKGMIPLVFIIGGVLAFVMGVSSFQKRNPHEPPK